MKAAKAPLGPFTESKEQVAGYSILECKDMDEAIKWVTKGPGGDDGAVEIRAIFNSAEEVVEAYGKQAKDA